MKRFLIMAVFLLLTVGSAQAQRLAVSSAIANVRSGPGTEYDILWKVERYYPIETLKKENQWYYFKDFEGDRGWLHESLVGDMKTVVTISSSCNIRSGPSTDYAVAFTPERGTPFKVLGREGNWLKIEHTKGYRGWIYKSLVW
ncbi:MAG: SH3 domain-containing protein [Desulfobacterales bacterium]|nr:SH3 domain-containing protein [Desulfobacterales bacterium]